MWPPASISPHEPHRTFTHLRGKWKLANAPLTARAGMTRQLQDPEQKDRRRGLCFCLDNTEASQHQHTAVLSFGQSDCSPTLLRENWSESEEWGKTSYAPSLSLSRGEEERSAPWQRKACSKWQQFLYFLHPIQHANGAAILFITFKKCELHSLKKIKLKQNKTK